MSEEDHNQRHFCCPSMEKAVMFSSNVPVFIHSTAFPENFSMSDFFSGIFTRDFLEVLIQFTRESFQGKLDGHRSVCV